MTYSVKHRMSVRSGGEEGPGPSTWLDIRASCFNLFVVTANVVTHGSPPPPMWHQLPPSSHVCLFDSPVTWSGRETAVAIYSCFSGFLAHFLRLLRLFVSLFPLRLLLS